MSDIKGKDVEEFCRFLIALGGIYNVDEEGYVCNKMDIDEPVLFKVGTQYKRIMVMKETITDRDAMVINPLNENASESPDSKWLYSMLNIGLAKRVIDIARFLKDAIESEKNNDEVALSLDTIEFASKNKEFDAKVLEQFNHLSKKRIAFINVWFNRKMKESRLRCSIYDKDTAAEFPHMTKKAWKVIGGLIGDLFGLSRDIEVAAVEINKQYSVTSDLISVPKLESILKIYMKLYTHMNKYLAMCEMDDEDFVIDLTSLGHHISHIEDYYQKAKWFTGNVVSNVPSNIKPAEGSIPVVTSGIPSNPMATQRGIGYTEPESNIPSNPMRNNPDVMHPSMFQNPNMINTGVVQTIGSYYNPRLATPMGNQSVPIGNFNSGFGVPIY